MRRIIIIIVSSFIIVFLFNACGSEKVQDVRQIVYNKLPKEKREQIKTSWDEGEIFPSIGSDGVKMYRISFRITDDKITPNNMLVLVSRDGKYEILGFPGVD